MDSLIIIIVTNLSYKFEDMMIVSSNEEGYDDFRVLAGSPKGRTNGTRVMARRNESRHDYGE